MGQCAHSLGECQWDLWLPLPDKTRPVHLFPYRACLFVGGSLGHSRACHFLVYSQQISRSCSSFSSVCCCGFFPSEHWKTRVVSTLQFCPRSIQDNLTGDDLHRAWCPVPPEYPWGLCPREEEARL